MAEKEFDINVVTTRVRQLILKYKEVQRDNEALYAMIDEHEKQIELLKSQLAESQRNYASLKAAKMLEITDGDVETSKRRIRKLIRDVDCCIALFNDKDSQK